MSVRPGTALWNLGFRPFYLMAGGFALVSILCWVAQFAGWLGSHSYLAGPLWHAHEMIFGYAFAVVVGFLFTAVRNWTGQPTPTGRSLMVIAVLWLAARLLAPSPWPWLAGAADVGFALAAAAGIARPLRAGGSRRNYFFVALLVGLGAANLAFHFTMAGVTGFAAGRLLQLALDLLLFIMAVMAGRVLPMFTANALPGAQPRRHAWLERVALGSLLLLLLADAFLPMAAVLAALCAVAALAHGARWLLWQPWLSRHKPLLWILHLSYAWIVVHLVLRALAALDVVTASAATHALAVGALGGLTLGMMTRTARGHTGRPLEASREETAAYVLIQLAALVRVLVPVFLPSRLVEAVAISGVLWVLAFALFLWRFVPMLCSPRADGRPG